MKLRDQTKLKLRAIVITVMISGLIGILYAGLIQDAKPINLLKGLFMGGQSA